MSREMTELMTRGSRRDPTLTPLQRAVYRGKMLSLQRRGIDRSSAMLRPSEGFVYWKNHIVMRVARHFDSVIIITGDVGTGKPLGRGQGVLMHDGSVKKVEDILVGDVVMGPNSEPRHVLDITAGYGPLVRVIPLKTDPFIVGAEHPLTVRQTSRTSPIGRALVSPRGQGHARGWRRPRKTSCAPPTTNYEALQSGGWLRDIPAYNFLTKTNRSQWKLLQSEELSFAHRSELPLSPWLVGALLGDGALTVARRVGFTKSDAEVLRRYREELLRLSLVPKEYQKAGHAAINIVLFGDTVLARTLTSLGLLPITCERRFIPSEYLRATVAERMELLAGLLDTDGDVGPSGECNYTSKSRQLVSDVVFLARSLGFKTHFREMHKCDQNKTWGTYYACSIIGDTIRIPLVSQHKKERLKTHDSFKLPLVEGFRVELAGEGAHYCIVVDGDHRFLMSNFLFTHNSTLALRLAQSFEPGFDIKRLCYSASDLLEAYETVQPGQVVLFDEPLALGQGVLMYDGTVKKIEDVAVGDKMMGPDSQPRNVLSTQRGSGPLLRIHNSRQKPSYVVGENHILALRNSGRSPILIKAKDVPMGRQSYWSYSTPPVVFSNSKVSLPIEPYLLGLLLGDGHLSVLRTPAITTMDAEVDAYCKNWAAQHGYEIRRDRKPLNKAWTIRFTQSVQLRKHDGTMSHSVMASTLVEMGLLPVAHDRKFIPQCYKTALVEERLKLLAGLIDTDGSVPPKGPVVYSTTSEQLANDVAFVARSLGFNSTVRPTLRKADHRIAHDCRGFKVDIMGDVQQIPMIVKRKQLRLNGLPKRTTTLDCHFEIERLPAGEHCCVHVDGDGLYVLDSFVVTHNSVRGLQAGDQSTREQKALIQALVLVREKGAILMLCVPDIFLIAKQIRQKRATLWLHVMERGVALIHERNSYLRYEADNTLGFSRSRNVPLLEWKPFKSTDKLWIAYQDLKRRRLDEYLHETKELLSGKKKGPQAGETKKEYNARRQRERRERMAVSTSEPEPVSNPDTTPLDDEPRGKNRMQKALEKAAETPVSAETK